MTDSNENTVLLNFSFGLLVLGRGLSSVVGPPLVRPIDCLNLRINNEWMSNRPESIHLWTSLVRNKPQQKLLAGFKFQRLNITIARAWFTTRAWNNYVLVVKLWPLS